VDISSEYQYVTQVSSRSICIIESVKHYATGLAWQLKYIVPIYLLIGAVGGYLLEWLEIDEAVRGDFAVVPAAGIVAIIVMSVAAVFLYRVIDRDIDQIRKSPPEKHHE